MKTFLIFANLLLAILVVAVNGYGWSIGKAGMVHMLSVIPVFALALMNAWYLSDK